ncbi:serine/threonine-protein kinase [Streptomyces alboflavus]|uniref:serine/threonine-protein kinase n=1 Tax=Streptomyces alboflavus TaxID=67267 RepID=UPI000A5BE765|nr:serine/threonine-protein kinase [Streptomyces alboflavus]
MVGGRIGAYVIVRELGSGGMGSVYLGRSRAGRAVALKVIRAEYAADPEFRRRFREEVAAARKVGGFHTAAVVDADPDAPQPWMASAYIEGPTLAEEIARRGPLDERRLWALAAALAEALQAVHACGLVHRDLKPGNIVLAVDGPRVLDFGIARAAEATRVTVGQMAVGTPGFIAPEQAQGHEVTGACDVFALGAVLVAAAGGSAFGQGQAYGLLYRAVHEEADVSALPGALRPLAAACLRKEPHRRPTPEQVLVLCADHLDMTAPEPAEPTQPRPTPSEPVRTRPAPPPPRPRRAAAHPPRPEAAPDTGQIAPYPRSRRSRALLLLRVVLLTLALAAIAWRGDVIHASEGLRVIAGVLAFLMVLVVLGTVTLSDGLVLNDLGIGIASPRSVAVLRWSEVVSVELGRKARHTVLTVRMPEGHRLPVSFTKPWWVRRYKDGTFRIRTAQLTPGGGAGPLVDTLRSFAARHGVPVTDVRDG